MTGEDKEARPRNTPAAQDEKDGSRACFQSDADGAERGDAAATAGDIAAAGVAAANSQGRAGKTKSGPRLEQGCPIRPRRAAVGAAVAVLGAALPFLIMASDRRWGFSVPVGLLGCAIAAFGILEALTTFEDPEQHVTDRVDPSRVGSRLLELFAAGVSHVVALRVAVAGSLSPQLSDPGARPLLPILSAAVLVTATFLWGVVALYRVGQALGVWRSEADGARRGLLRRHGFWLIVLTTVVYLPLLGSYSLSDPWETHYAEVAREMLARDDWISLWWAQDGWFWSKPILAFWLEGLCCSLLGVRYAPDQMIASVAQGRFPAPEWALRMPAFVLSLAGVYLLYKGVARALGRRAALLGSLVLVTTPYWFFLAHQSMTDMLYVGPLTGAMGLFLLGFHTDPEARVRVYEIPIGTRRLRVSGYHLLFGLLILCVLPQVLYLAARHVTLQIDASPHGFRLHLDEFFSGSGGDNCGLPGNRECRRELPVYRTFQPGHAALAFSAVAGVLLWLGRGERRTQRLYFLAAWLLVVLSAMGKGAPGLVLGMLVPLVFVGATRRWSELTRLEMGTGVLVFGCVLLPWFVQMYMRHGQPFTDRLLFHDMYKRAFTHVHDTNQGVDTSFRYYVWQLGYGLFPWTGLIAGSLVWWQRVDGRDRRHDTAVFLVLWFLLAFSMFAISLTKFHHYVLPAVPPAAMLAGWMLDDALSGVRWPQPRRLVAYLGGSLTGACLLVYGVLRCFPGSISGAVNADGQPPTRSLVVGALAVLLGIVTAVASAVVAFRTRAAAPSAAEVVGEQAAERGGVMLGAVGIGAAAVVAVVGRDLFTSLPGDTAGAARLVHLFCYNYSRPWPPSLDFDAVFVAFTVVSAVLCALLLLERWRPQLVTLLGCTALLWTAWGVNVYLVRASPHWGQRETVSAYYLDRSGPEEPFVSYQMNWKGENFYTGNRTPAFVSSGTKFENWVREQKAEGVKVFYFTTEPSRVKTLRRELGNPKDLEILTTPELNNKFLVARLQL
jgi:4-amino-4-deoxy-L-arabinose transferase-like glycosyltransferase